MQIPSTPVFKLSVMLFRNLASVAMAVLAGNAYAQPSQVQIMDFPNKPVRVVSPYRSEEHTSELQSH